MTISRNPLQYLGVEARTPPNTFREERAPTAADNAQGRYSPGDIWVDVTGNVSYILIEIIGTTASWSKASSTSGSVDTLTGNSGAPVTGDGAGNIDVIGGTNAGVLLAGTANTLTASLVNTVVVPNTSISWTTPALEFDGVASGSFANSEHVNQQAGVQIAAVTTATVHSVTLADPQTITVVWEFSASLDPATEAGGGTVTAIARRSGGFAILLGVPVVVYNSDFAGADSVTADVNANDLRLRYTTGTNGPVNIIAFASFQPLISNA